MIKEMVVGLQKLVLRAAIGALTSRPYAYSARGWELRRVESVDFLDVMCPNILICTRDSGRQVLRGARDGVVEESISRILPRGGYGQDTWISDRTRYAFDGASVGRSSKLPSVIPLSSGWGARVGLLFSGVSDVEEVYVLARLVRRSGSSDIQLGTSPVVLNLDVPLVFSFNLSLKEGMEGARFAAGILSVGAAPRYEASLINTWIRGRQRAGGMIVSTLSSFSSNNHVSSHESNSGRGILSLIENRTGLSIVYHMLQSPAILFSYESFRLRGGLFLQDVGRYLGKKLHLQDKKGLRLGVLHNSIGGLAVSYLGLQPGVRSIVYSREVLDKGMGVLYAHQSMGFASERWLSSVGRMGLVRVSSVGASRVSISNAYERSGMLVDLEGRLRAHKKAIRSPVGVRPLQAILCAGLFGLINAQHNGMSSTLKTMLRYTPDDADLLWGLSKELPVDRLCGGRLSTFITRALEHKEGGWLTRIFAFYPPVENFYSNDIISTNSKTMAECSLFLSSGENLARNL